MFTRTAIDEIRRRSGQGKVLVVVGAHGCGKTSAVRAALTDYRHLDCADAAFVDAYSADPLGTLLGIERPTVIDNAEKLPQLFTVLPWYAGHHPAATPLVVLSSVNPVEHVGSTMDETRGLSVLEIGGLLTAEVFPSKPTEGWRQLWLRGGSPRAFLGNFADWHEANIRRLAGEICARAAPRRPPEQIIGLLRVLSAQHGQALVPKKIMDASGLSRPELSQAISALTDRFVIRLLTGVNAGTGEHCNRVPRLYFRDCGLLHTLLGIRSESELEAHPMRQTSWEGFIIEEHLLGRGCRTPGDEPFFLFRDTNRRVIPMASSVNGFRRALFAHPGIADSQFFRVCEKRAAEFGCQSFQIVDFTVATWGIPQTASRGEASVRQPCIA